MMRVGLGYDSHKLVKGRKLILGGVEIPFEKGLSGHSDADVLCHAIMDAILGALGSGDIGTHFPDTDHAWKDVSSIKLLSMIVAFMKEEHFEISWIDSIVISERPRLQPFIAAMKEKISAAGIPSGLMNVKATTNEGMGFVGRGEGIAAQAVCLLKPSQSGTK